MKKASNWFLLTTLVFIFCYCMGYVDAIDITISLIGVMTFSLIQILEELEDKRILKKKKKLQKIEGFKKQLESLEINIDSFITKFKHNETN